MVTCRDECPGCSATVRPLILESAWRQATESGNAARRAIMYFQQHLLLIHMGSFHQAFVTLDEAAKLMGCGDRPKPPTKKWKVTHLSDLRGRTASAFDQLLTFAVLGIMHRSEERELLYAACRTAEMEADSDAERSFFMAAARFIEAEGHDER